MNFPEKVRLARAPTPIEPLRRLSKELGVGLFAWRDDLTGFAESGNKVRKLEFLVAEALRQGATSLVTCGGPQSNHARATAVAARRLGLGISLVLREPPDGTFDSGGNYLLDRLYGAAITRVSYADYRAAGSVYDSFLDREATALRRRGETPYVIPEGGSSPLGCLGYASAVEEMLVAWRGVAGTERPDALFVALGSGGTYAGLHLGLERAGISPSVLHAVNVCDDAAYFRKRIGGIFEGLAEMGHPVREKGIQICDGHVGKGYSLATDEELAEYARVARTEGLLLDPCYTGKAFLGMKRELARQPARFGKNILFLHSGGGFATFSYREQYDRALKTEVCA